jgi:hypothetical protein
MRFSVLDNQEVYIQSLAADAQELIIVLIRAADAQGSIIVLI